MKKIFIMILLILISFGVLACNNNETTTTTGNITTEFTFTPNPETEERSGYLELYVGINQDVFEIGTSESDVSRNIYLVSENNNYILDEDNYDFSKVNLNVPGYYSIYVDVLEGSSIVGTYALEILVKDGKVPVITGVKNYHIDVLDTLPNLMEGVDALDDNLNNVTFDHSIDTSKPGLYQVVYIATDYSGNVAIEYANVLVGNEYYDTLVKYSDVFIYQPTTQESEVIQIYQELVKMVYENDNDIIRKVRSGNNYLLTKGLFEEVVNRPIRADELEILEAYKDIKIKDEIAALELIYNRALTTDEILDIENYRDVFNDWIDYNLDANQFFSYPDMYLFYNEYDLDQKLYMEHFGYTWDDFLEISETVALANLFINMQVPVINFGIYDPAVELNQVEVFDIQFYCYMDDLIEDPDNPALTASEKAILLETQEYNKMLFYVYYIDSDNLDYTTYESAYNLIIEYVRNLGEIQYQLDMSLYPDFINVIYNFYLDGGYDTLTVAEKELYIGLVNNIDYGYYYVFDETVTEEEQAIFTSLIYGMYALGTDLCINCQRHLISHGSISSIENRLGRALTTQEIDLLNKYRDGLILYSEEYFFKYLADYDLNNTEYFNTYHLYNNKFYSFKRLLNEYDSNYEESMDTISYFILNGYFDTADYFLTDFKANLKKTYQEFYDFYSVEWNLDNEGLTKLVDLYNIDYDLYDDLHAEYVMNNEAYYHTYFYQLSENIINDSGNLTDIEAFYELIRNKNYPDTINTLEDYTNQDVVNAFDELFIIEALREIDLYLKNYVNVSESNMILYDELIKLEVAKYIVSTNIPLEALLINELYGEDEYVIKYLTMLNKYRLAVSSVHFLQNLDNYEDYKGLEKDLAELGYEVNSYYDIDILLINPDCFELYTELEMLKEDVLETAIEKYFYIILRYDYDITDYSAFYKFKDMRGIYSAMHERYNSDIIIYYYNNINNFTQAEQDVVNLFVKEELDISFSYSNLRDYVTKDDIYNVYMKLLDHGISIENIMNDQLGSYASETFTEFERFVYYSSKNLYVKSYVSLEPLLIAEDYTTLAEVFRVGIYDNYYTNETPFDSYIQAKALSRDLTQAEIDSINDYLEWIYYPNILGKIVQSYPYDFYLFDEEFVEVINVLSRINKHPNNDPLTSYDLRGLYIEDTFIRFYDSISKLTLTTSEQIAIDKLMIKLTIYPNQSLVYLYGNEDYNGIKYEYFKLVYQHKGSELLYPQAMLEYVFTETELETLTQAELDIIDAYMEIIAYERLDILVYNSYLWLYPNLLTFDDLESFTVLLDLLLIVEPYQLTSDPLTISDLETELGITLTQAQTDALLTLCTNISD